MLSDHRIKNIVFDLGGVLLDIDFNQIVSALGQVGINQSHLKLNNASFIQFYKAFEQGELDEDEFAHQLNTYLGLSLNKKQVINIWNRMLVGASSLKLAKLKELSKTYFVYLLSNTNPTHWKWIKQHYLIAHNCDFEQLFQRVFLSHEMGLSKPDPLIFRRVVEETQIAPPHTLLIDDRRENTDVAIGLGFHVYTPQTNSTDWVNLFE